MAFRTVLLYGFPHCITLLAYRTALLCWLTALHCITLLAYRTALHYTTGLPHCITLLAYRTVLLYCSSRTVSILFLTDC